MRRVSSGIFVLLLLATSARAQVDLQYRVDLTGPTAVFLPFTVTQSGTFSFSTANHGARADPFVHIFRSTIGPATTVPELWASAWHDHPHYDAVNWQGGHTVFLESHADPLTPYYYTFLASGNGSLIFDDHELRLYIESNAPFSCYDYPSCNYDLMISSDNGGLSLATPNSTVPEPVSMALLGTGLAGIGAVRRKRRTEAEAA